ncbi:MAG: hypothetical protein ACRDTQ_17120 [Micromonosporaceae bacterium]
MSTAVRELFAGLIDDAAVFPPGNAPLPDAVVRHREHRGAWYQRLVGPLLIPASRHAELLALLDPAEHRPVGLIGDEGLAGFDAALAAGPSVMTVRQVEWAVARRGQDPLPGLRSLLAWAQGRPFDVYAEIPLTDGCMAALDLLAETSASRVSPKFRTGGLAAELFPSPAELAEVIVACARSELRFKLTAGLHHAVRHVDPKTGFTHHGFLNVLAASAAADGGAAQPDVERLLSASSPDPLLDLTQEWLDQPRPLWVGFGSCDIAEPLEDLMRLGLI